MALSDVLAHLRGALAGLGPDAPEKFPKSLGNRLTWIVWAVPNTSTPMQHAGRNGGAVVQAVDDVMVELHRITAEDDVHAAVEEVTPLFDAAMFKLWYDFADSRWGGTIVGLRSVNTETFGPLGYGTRTTFGFRLVCTVDRAIELVQ